MVKLQLGDYNIDVGEFQTTLNFSIADIREPDKRNASYSKTLKLPGTKANNEAFEFLFEVDIQTQTFNPNKKARVILSLDTITQFKGALKLKQINYLEGGRVEYETNLIGNLMDIIQEFGNLRISDLDLSAYNHTYSKAVIETSWNPTLGIGYCYPMINYGTISDLALWSVYDFKPATFVKTVWDKMFSDAGYTYSSAFLNSDLFKRLILPCSQARLNIGGATITDRSINVGRLTDYVEALGTTDGDTVQVIIPINEDTAGAYFDNDGSFDVTTFKHSPIYSAHMDYSLTFDGSVKVVKNTTGASNTLALDIYIDLIRDRNGVLTPIQGAGGTYYWNAPAAAGTYTITTDQFGITQNNQFFAQMVDVNAGDDLYLRLTCVTNGSVGAEITSVEWVMGDISLRNSFSFTGILEGDTIVLSDTLSDMLQKDLFMGIVRMFNLFIEPDPNNDTILNIEPRDDYYISSVEDWTGKLDTGKDIEIEPMALLNFKRLICSYKSDNDYYNKNYKEEFNRVYGDYRADIDNDFVNGEYKIETAFAATPLVGSYDNDRIIPTILESSGTPPQVAPISAEPRILYWKGLESCETWDFNSQQGSTSKTQYPYAGHLDDPQAPTLDLSFGVPQKVYYGVNQFITSLTYTDANLFNTYYKKMIDEVTHRDSKLVSAWFWLTAVDILNLDFSKIYRVKNHYLRLNKVIDYSPVASRLTKCEFIKVKDHDVQVATSVIMNGGLDIVINSKEDAPVIDLTTFVDGNVVARPSSTVITGEKNYAGGGLSTVIHGRRNRVHGRDSSGVAIWGEDNTAQAAASGVTIHGYGNNIGFGVKNIFVQGNGNTVLPGLMNVTLIATDNTTVTESNFTYINGEPIARSQPPCMQFCTDWQEFNTKTIGTVPIDILTASPAGHVYIPKFVIFALRAGGTSYDYSDAFIIGFETTLNTFERLFTMSSSFINSTTDQYVVLQITDTTVTGQIKPGEKLQVTTVTGGGDATTGNGKFYFKVIYQDENLPV